MEREKWKRKIKAASRKAGTYKPYFDSVIDTLAGIMELRDKAQDQFVASGGQTIVRYTNKAGATNPAKNPALIVIMDCNAQALAYWRDLGLTPAGLKRINEEGLKESNKSALDAALESFSLES